MNSFFKTFLSRVFLLVVFSAQMVLANETFFRSEDFISEDKVYDKFSSEIKPILDKRCVVCHSCSESPCQLKLESIEGLERGAKKESVRGSLLFRNSGNRLFFDASSVGEWRKKNFYSVIEPIDYNGEPVPSVMLRALVEGHTNLEDSPPSKKRSDWDVKGMPFRLAPLDTETEYSPLVNWLVNGAVLPSAEVIENSRKTKSPEVVTQWEDFFNNPTNKGKWTARYLYEHLFETHFYIDEAPGEFFEIVRSKTKSPEKIVAISSDHETESPFERAYEMMNAEPKVFYYRLRKIHSTIVFKNHIIYHVNNNKLDHLKKTILAK